MIYHIKYFSVGNREIASHLRTVLKNADKIFVLKFFLLCLLLLVLVSDFRKNCVKKIILTTELLNALSFFV